MTIYYTVYKTTNLINDKIYIGVHKTKNPNDDYLGSNEILKSDIQQYGKNNFKKEILFVFDNEEHMWNKERELVNEEFISRDDTYNIGLGGMGWTGLGRYIVENKVGILSDDYLNNKKSEVSKRVLSNRTPEDRYKMASTGGKKGSETQMKNKSGIFGKTKEERSEHGKYANSKLKEKGLGFYSSKTQSELGKRGGPKNKGFRWYNDGSKDYKYTAKQQAELSFEEFLSENPEYRPDRLKREYKPREKSRGKRTLTNGVKNIMLFEEEAKIFLVENPEYRYGRTNFKTNIK